MSKSVGVRHTEMKGVNQARRREYLARRTSALQKLPEPSVGVWQASDYGTHAEGWHTYLDRMDELGIVERTDTGVYRTTDAGWEARQSLLEPEDGGWYPCGHRGKADSRDLPEDQVRCAKCDAVWHKSQVDIGGDS